MITLSPLYLKTLLKVPAKSGQGYIWVNIGAGNKMSFDAHMERSHFDRFFNELAYTAYLDTLSCGPYRPINVRMKCIK